MRKIFLRKNRKRNAKGMGRRKKERINRMKATKKGEKNLGKKLRRKQ